MGIFGFGSFRDKFAVAVDARFLETGGYVACMDVTSVVVGAIRNSETTENFARSLARGLDCSREIRFLRQRPPLLLRYTLDNRSPRAKRQTQMQRMVDSRSLIARLCSDQRQRSPLRISNVVDRIRELLLRRYRLATKTTEFDYEEGEGELKAINWLSDQRGDLPRLIMSRDNDVYVYLLSITRRRNHDDKEPGYVIYHEASDCIMRCWTDLMPYYRPKAWLLLLWISVCYGNDYAHGVLDKSLDSLKTHFSRLQHAFLQRANDACFYDDDDCVFRNDADGSISDTSSVLVLALDWLRDALRNDNNDNNDEDKADAERDDRRLRTWLARQIWSFYYIVELPRGFSRDECFRGCPSIKINASLDMPYISRNRFVTIGRARIAKAVSSILLHGL